MALNGNVKLIGAMITAFTLLTSGVIANEVRNVEEHIKIRRETQKDILQVQNKLTDKLELIIAKLSKIEGKLENDR